MKNNIRITKFFNKELTTFIYIVVLAITAISDNLISTSQNTMYCGGEPEHHIRNVTSRI